jgi:diguanylate cyclase (GGDEF)-like protein/PAS domain S-box-containing protein
MKQLLGAKIHILLVNDDQQALSELTCLLEEKTISQHEIVCRQPDSFSSLDDLSQAFDLGIMWIKDKKNLPGKLSTNKEVDQPPFLLVTHFELSADQQAELEGKFVEQLLFANLTPTLMNRTISSIYFERQLQNQVVEEQNVKAILDVVSEGVLVCDDHGDIVFMNPVAEKMFGTKEKQVKHKPLVNLLAGSQIGSIEDFFSGKAGNKNAVLIKEAKGRRNSDEVFPVELVISRALLMSDLVYTCTVRDITHIKLRDQEFNLAATIFESHTAMLITDRDGIILRVNPAFTQITGYSAEEVIGENPRVLQSGHQTQEFYKNFWNSIKETGKWEGEIWNKRKDGEIYPEYQTITAVVNHKGDTTHYVATFQDITERKQTQALIEHQAFYDALTNLPNRRLILDRLNQELSAARRHNFYGALLFMDLDHFKTLNDSMGHAVGDELLQQMADRLSDQVRKEDTVARLGGDEFVVLLANLGTDDHKAGQLANTIATKIHKALIEPYMLQGNSLKFTSSIGISLFPFDDENADDVLKHADSAMYRAKHMGRNSICFYKPSMQEDADRRLKVEKDLRLAIDNKELSLYYQPQFDRAGRVVGVEALMRWKHPDEGIILPGEFIALAEEVNLIQSIGDWALESAVQQYMRWKSSGIFRGDEYVSVNVSPKQLQQADFVTTVSQLMVAYDMPPENLKLEITESVLMSDLREITAKMHELKEIGITFSMDDFGTGFSSLTYLKRLPFDQIKIDKTFVRDASQSMNDAAIVETIIAMAEHLNLDVIAEGVETREEMEFLHEKGCNGYQGFYFSTPLPVTALESFLKDWAQKDSVAKLG